MGSINIDNTGTGADVTLSSDGTDLLLDGTAIGGGGGASAYTIDNKTASYTIVSGDLGKIINCTSGTFTITLTAAATLGSGFSVYIWNTGTGAITIDGNASETIDGETTYILRQNEGTEIVCDGSNFTTGAKKTMRGYAENLPSTYGKPVASGAGAIALGNRNGDAVYLSQAQGTRSFAVNGYATANYSAAIGQNSSGGGAEAGGNGAMALGGSYASGSASLAAAINTNSTSYGATGSNSIAMGRNSKATGGDAFAAGGFAVATTTSSIAMGPGAKASGLQAVAIGFGAEATEYNSVAIGGRNAKSDVYGKIVFGGYFTGYQAGLLSLAANTTDATPKNITSNNGTATAGNQVILPNNSAYAFHGTIVARQKAGDGTASAAWKVEGLIRREGSAGTTVLVNSATTVLDNTPSWGMALSADTTNGGLAITATGAASTNIRWVATIHTSEVTYA